jgi:ParB family chromosome partitioning protein
MEARLRVAISSILLKKRMRQELQGIEDLAESMNRLGQLSPIIITDGNVLVAGRRRLEAAKSLGWKTIEATMLAPSNKLRIKEIELDENVQRCALRGDEIQKAVFGIEKLRNPGLFRRIWNCIGKALRRMFRIKR